MPGKIWVKVHRARDLPVMDKSADTTDAFVEIRFGPSQNMIYKTDVCPKTLSPKWETEWMTFEAEDHEIQDESVVFKVMDYDTYSANDAIGRIYFDLNPLIDAAQRLEKERQRDFDDSEELFVAEDKGILADSMKKLQDAWTQSAEMTGWLPILDTLNGIRGALEVTVRLELFADRSIFRQSSCGVEVFSSPVIPQGYKLAAVHGLVEELLVAGDPEYQWIDRIRTPRATNEARQGIFRKLSSELLRKLGRKALGLGGNAVVGTRVMFDMEGPCTGLISIRGLGTAVTLNKLSQLPLKVHVEEQILDCVDNSTRRASRPSPHSADPPERRRRKSSRSSTTSNEGSVVRSTSPEAKLPTVRRISMEESNLIETTKPTQDSPSVRKNPRYRPPARTLSATDGCAALESFPDTQVLALCPELMMIGQESSRGPELPFLTLQQMPDRSVSGYGGVVCARSVRLLEDIEHKEGSDAADVRGSWWVELREELRSHMKALACNAILGYKEELSSREGICILSASGTAVSVETEFWHGGQTSEQSPPSDCSFCHISYSLGGKCFARALYRCAVCGDAHVPDLILATSEPPKDIELLPRLIQVPVVRKLVHHEGEELAKEISNLLPFVEHEMHGSLLKELQCLGGNRNSVFSLRIAFALGDGVLVAIGTGTAVRLRPLTQCKDIVNGHTGDIASVPSRVDFLDLTADRNAACIVIDGSEHTGVMSVGDFLGNTASSMLLLDHSPTGRPKEVSAGDRSLHCAPQLCLRIWRGPLSVSGSSEKDILSQNADSENLKSLIDWLLKATFYKFKRRQRVLCGGEQVLLRHVMFSVEMVEDSDSPDIQLFLCGMVLNNEVSDCPTEPDNVILSSMPATGVQPVNYLGHYDLVIIRETSSLKEQGGMDAFVRLAVGDVFQAVKAHVRAYGGDSLLNLGFTLTELNGSVHKNQAQCLLGVTGDIVTFESQE